MPRFPLHIDSLARKRTVLIEYTLLLAVGVVTLVMWKYERHDPVLLHLYYIPVVLTGFFLGCYRARFMALLCILSATVVLIPGTVQPLTQILADNLLPAYCVWTATIMLVAVLVGKLSDGWRAALESLRHEHRKDVLTDPLTGIANRRAYEFELKRRVSQAERDGTPVTLLMLDIDLFKKLNDRFGHPAGDAVLKGVADILQATIRKCDLAVRYGGEEFSVILPGISFSEASDVAERIRTLIESHRFSFNQLTLRTTVSIGFAQYQSDDNIDSLTRRADAALYSAKEAGRNAVYFHDGQSCRHQGIEFVVPANTNAPQERLISSLKEAYADETTGLPGQRVLVEELRRRTAECNRYGTELVVALVHVDHYAPTPLNQVHAKKSLLANTARLICSQLRETDLVVRFGEDTFGILMPSTTIQGASVPLDRICAHALTYRDTQYAGLSYSVSIGAAEVVRNGQPGSTIHHANSALNRAVAAGEGCVKYYHPTNSLELSHPL